MAKRIEQLRNGDEFVRWAECRGAEVRNGKGSHFIVSTQRGSCVVPVHNKDLGKGLRCKIVKLFLKLGLTGIFLGVIIMIGSIV